MAKPFYLKMDTDKGVITIPFLGMRELDEFTVLFSDGDSLVNFFIRLLNLSINTCDVSMVYLTDDKYKTNWDERCLPIKYEGDNFNYQSLKEVFAEYLTNNPNRILLSDIRYSRSIGILRYYDTNTVLKYEIDRAVGQYFSPSNGYKRKRDTYFLIEQTITDEERESEKFTIHIEPVIIPTDIDRTNLSRHGTDKDDYLNYLIELSQRSEEDFQRAMDEIGQSDLEDIRSNLVNGNYGIVDGASDEYDPDVYRIKVLEETTGVRASIIQDTCSKFGRRRKPR